MNEDEREEVLGIAVIVGLVAFGIGYKVGYRNGYWSSQKYLLHAFNSAQRFRT